MRIKYKILWVDDRKETFEKAGYDKRIQDYVRGLFLEPQLTLCESVEEAKEVLQTKTFDVIFSDFNISDSDSEEQGNDFIRYVREQNVNTEILFYSAMEELPPMHVNRISFFSFAGQKGAYQELLAQMELLINLTIEKLNDITALRGLVMAEVSELDGKMQDIIEKYYVLQETDALKQTFYEHIILKNEGRLKEFLVGCEKKEKVCYHKWKNVTIHDIIPHLEAAQLAKAVYYIVPKDLYTSSRANFYEDYKAEIMDIRNELAHCADRIEGSKEILITRKGDKSFNKEDIKEVRKNILKYSALFAKLLQ